MESGANLIARIAGSGSQEDYVVSLYSNDAEADMCDNFDLDTVTAADIAEARAYFAAEAQAHFAPATTIQVFRYGTADAGSICIGATTDDTPRHFKAVHESRRWVPVSDINTFNVPVANIVGIQPQLASSTYNEDALVFVVPD
jgi:hypothetical protein